MNCAVRFVGDSLKFLPDFPEACGMMRVINSIESSEAISPTISSRCRITGNGVEETRFSSSSGAYRVIYLARHPELGQAVHWPVSRHSESGGSFWRKTPYPRGKNKSAQKGGCNRGGTLH